MNRYDYVIIGSGPSGGVIAYNLVKAGAKVLMLEAGKFHRKNTFPRNEADATAQLYWGGGIEFSKNAKMAFLRAKVVGGTSIVNQCLLDRFDDYVWDDWRSRTGVSWMNEAEMNETYAQVEENLSLHIFDKSEFNKNAELFTLGCEKLGVGWQPLRRGQNDCATQKGNDCISCLSGCHRDSKQSSLVVAIQKAEKLGLEIWSETFTDRIEQHTGGYRVYGYKSGEKFRLDTPKLIVAAGSFGTNQILLKSGFKKELPMLGEKFSSHPQFMSLGIYDDVVDAHKGAFQTVTAKGLDVRSKGFKLENVFATPVSISMLIPNSGKLHQNYMKKIRNMACIEVAVRDENVGKIKIANNGRLVIEKDYTEQDLQRRDSGLELIKNIMIESGAKEIIESPFSVGLHLMGGCSLGTEADNGVVNPEFEVFGKKNLFVADSSTFPAAPGINPSLTIMAFSQRLSDNLIKSH